MKKIFSLCVICLFAATICQAADSKFDVDKNEAPTPPNRACACSNVDVTNVINADTPEKLDKAMKKQVESLLVKVKNIDTSKLSPESLQTIQDVQNIKNELAKCDVEIPTFVNDDLSARQLNRMVWAQTVYSSKKPIKGWKKVDYQIEGEAPSYEITVRDYWKAHKATIDKLQKIVTENSKITK